MQQHSTAGDSRTLPRSANPFSQCFAGTINIRILETDNSESGRALNGCGKEKIIADRYCAARPSISRQKMRDADWRNTNRAMVPKKYA